MIFHGKPYIIFISYMLFYAQHITGLCAGNSLVTGEFPTQMTSNAENVYIWWRHHEQSSMTHFAIVTK